MSNGDDADDAPEESASADETDDAPAATDEAAAPALPDELTEESLRDYLDEIETQLEAAETEADLDDIDALVDDAESGVADADLPEPDEDDDDAEDPRGDLEARIEALREDIEDARGPYGEDVTDAFESSVTTVTDTEWTADGLDDVAEAVESVAGDVAVILDVDVSPESHEIDDLAAALEALAAAVTNANLDADADADTIDELLTATDALADDLDAAEEWDDLETNEQLRAQGFYDVLGHYKDYPVEWSALKEHEQRGNVDMILLALDSLQSDFMERHCLEALERMGKRAYTDDAVEVLLGRAGKRDQFAIRILGNMAATEATETLVEYVEEDSNPGLQKTTFKALGEIGATEAVQPIANTLAADTETEELVQPHAARALGLIGDTRAVDPLADILADTERTDDVRAAAAWALRQIGTQTALETVAAYTDERTFIIQTEADKASAALDAAAVEA